jgi:rhodanese-related sulfurtransferase
MFARFWYQYRAADPSLTSDETPAAGPRQISPAEVFARIQRNETVHFIDIRKRESFEAAHIIDAVWLSLTDIPHYQPPAGTLAVIVFGEENSPEQLSEIDALFKEKKFPYAFLEGGMAHWIARGGGVITPGDINSYIDQTKVIAIDPSAVSALRSDLIRSVFLDIRSEREYEESHASGATNIPLAQLESRRDSLPRPASLIVYGNTTSDGFSAGTQLFDMGFFGVRVITGGFEAWKNQGLPVESGNGSR